VTANADFTTGGNSDYVRYLTDHGADVIMFQEAKDFRVADMLPAGWTAYQVTSSDAKQGAALAVGPGFTMGRKWQVKGCDAPADGGMLPRWITCAEVTGAGVTFPAMSAHAPPPRYSALQPGFNAVLADVCEDNPGAVVGADANMDMDEFARALGPGMAAVGKQSGICLVSTVPLPNVDVDGWPEEYGRSDHPCVWADRGED
jgi:hypothetical protein